MTEDKPDMLFLILLFIFVIGLFTSFIMTNYYAGTARINACVDLGYADIGDSGSMSIYGSCADEEGNLHFVKWTCTKDFIQSCVAKNIKQGDVTGVMR